MLLYFHRSIQWGAKRYKSSTVANFLHSTILTKKKLCSTYPLIAIVNLLINITDLLRSDFTFTDSVQFSIMSPAGCCSTYDTDQSLTLLTITRTLPPSSDHYETMHGWGLKSGRYGEWGLSTYSINPSDAIINHTNPFQLWLCTECANLQQHQVILICG